MKNLIKISTKICGALLAALGFSALATSCTPKPLYGMPYSEYVSGKVTDKVTGKPIKGIKVTNWNAYETPEYGVPPANYIEISEFTDEDGIYHIYAYELHSHLTFSDVDGDKNGLYKDTTVTVDVNDIALTPQN